jgi:fused signal recognition particle receptor
MFKFLKDKLKAAISRFSKGAEAEPATEEKSSAEEESVVEENAPVEEKSAVIERAPETVVVQKQEPIIEKKKAAAPEMKQLASERKPQTQVQKHVPRIEPSLKQKPVEKKVERETVIEALIKKDEPVRPEKARSISHAPQPTPHSAQVKKPIEKKEEPAQTKPAEHKKGIFERITERVTTTAISDDRYEELFWDLEVVLLENNVAVEIIERIKENLRQELVHKKVRFGKTEETIRSTLTKTLEDVLATETPDLVALVKTKQPYVILFVGVNGVGKTTTIAKVAHLLQKHDLSSVMAAADTFRAAAIQQLEEHADRLKVKLIKHDYGADPAAVAFDAIQYAKAKRINVVLIDTAGRQHSNANLMQEMEKMVRVAKPDLRVFVGESITGNDCIEQAREFSETIGVDAIILSKADVDEKGGTAISISYLTKKPILFIGTGQGYDALAPFEPGRVLEGLGLSS